MKKRLYILIGIYLSIIVFFIWLTPRKVNWRDSFDINNKSPYGMYVFANEMDEILEETELSEESLYNSVEYMDDTLANYLFVTNEFYPSEIELRNLLEWVAWGNNAYISANSFSIGLLDSLNISSNYAYMGIVQEIGNPFGESNLKVAMGDTAMNHPNSDFIYKKQSSLIYFESAYDSLPPITIHAVAENASNPKSAIYPWEFPILVSQKYGEGRIFMHSLPYAFSNYYMLSDPNQNFAAQSISVLPDQLTYIDTYYKPFKRSDQVTFSTFLSQRAFKWAFIFGVSLLFMYLFFKIKRTQRMIPIVRPPENRSLEFATTIGDLYFHTDDRKDLFRKMEKHFKEFLKQKYYIHNFMGTMPEMEYLAIKSGKTIGLISTINTMFNQLRAGGASEADILKLSQKLHQFYYGRAK